MSEIQTVFCSPHTSAYTLTPAHIKTHHPYTQTVLPKFLNTDNSFKHQSYYMSTCKHLELMVRFSLQTIQLFHVCNGCSNLTKGVQMRIKHKEKMQTFTPGRKRQINSSVGNLLSKTLFLVILKFLQETIEPNHLPQALNNSVAISFCYNCICLS